MQVDLLEPYGFCHGVETAILTALSAKEANPDKDVYILGQLVHNEVVLESLKEKGLIVIEDEDLLSSIELIPDGSLVVFSAHGHCKEIDALASKKHLETIDCTCPFVKANAIAASKVGNLIYIGNPKHIECIQFAKDFPECIVFDVNTMTPSKDIKDVPYSIIGQTTLTEGQLNDSLKAIKAIAPTSTYIRGRCPDTQNRQKNVMECNDPGLFVVVGSHHSHNTENLCKTAISNGFKAVLVDSLDELKSISLGGYEKATVTSGTSCPKATVDSVVAYLESL